MAPMSDVESRAQLLAFVNALFHFLEDREAGILSAGN